MKKNGIEVVSLDEALSTADIVSFHAALNEKTCGIITKEKLDLLKDDALIVNTARAGILDEYALIERLKSGKNFAVLDVYLQEPLPSDHILRKLPNVIAKSHTSGSIDGGESMGIKLVNDIKKYLNGEKDIDTWIERSYVKNMTSDKLFYKLRDEAKKKYEEEKTNKMKNLFILGDSYSTYENHIPEGNACYYKENMGEIAPSIECVENTWWHKFIEKTGLNLILNESYSGSTICNTGYYGTYCPDTSFIGRFERNVKNGLFKNNDVDIVIIFGGTNDSWADVPVGKLMYENKNEEDIKCALPGFCYLLERVKTVLKDAEIYFVINTEIKKELTDNYKKACEKYGVEYIELTDINKEEGHPTILGMDQIFNQVYNYLKRRCKKTPDHKK